MKRYNNLFKVTYQDSNLETTTIPFNLHRLNNNSINLSASSANKSYGDNNKSAIIAITNPNNYTSISRTSIAGHRKAPYNSISDSDYKPPKQYFSVGATKINFSKVMLKIVMATVVYPPSAFLVLENMTVEHHSLLCLYLHTHQ